MKTDFIHRATHNLRTPVTTIFLMVSLLEGECTPREKREYFTVLKEELGKELTLIEDLLTVGRLESNHWVNKLKSIDPIESLHSSIQAISPVVGVT